MGSPAIVSLEALRARIREIEGTPIHPRRVGSGVPEIDALVGGLPCPGVVEVHGVLGAGRTRVALSLAAAEIRRGRPVAWVDPQRRFFPPAAAAVGVDPAALLVVQPPGDRDAWAIEQVCRSGAFALVVALDPMTKGRVGARWAHAAEAGACTLVVIGERPLRDLQPTVRLMAGDGEMVVARDRRGVAGARSPLPRLPDAGDPWR